MGVFGSPGATENCREDSSLVGPHHCRTHGEMSLGSSPHLFIFQETGRSSLHPSKEMDLELISPGVTSFTL